MKTLLVALFILMVNTIIVDAQNMLKLNKHRPAYYLTGNEIKLQLKSDNTKISGQIQSIGDNYIVVNEVTVPLSDIDAVYLKRSKLNLFADGFTLVIAGVGLLAVTGLNSAIINHTATTPNSTYYDSGGLAAAGLILMGLAEHRVAINERHQLKVISPISKQNP